MWKVAGEGGSKHKTFRVSRAFLVLETQPADGGHLQLVVKWQKGSRD